MYQGIVALEADSVGGLIEHYLATSEQLASRLVLGVGDGAARGVLLQRLPGTSTQPGDDDAWSRVTAELAATAGANLAGGSDDVAGIIGRLLPQEDVRIFAARPVSFACACSRERVEKALRIAGPAEVEAVLADRGFVDVTCKFCNRSYVFSPLEARAVFAPPASR